jgi:SH3-like domain-containing protein
MSKKLVKQSFFNPLTFLLLVGLFTTTCGGSTSSKTSQINQTPTAETDPSSINTEAENLESSVDKLPIEIIGPDGWILNISHIELLEAIKTTDEVLMPENGTFLLLRGSINNLTGKALCVSGNDFKLRDNKSEYKMSRDILEATQKIYKIDYPGFILGQCFSEDETKDTFLVFDISNDLSELWLKLEDDVEVKLTGVELLAQNISQSTLAPTEEPSIAATSGTLEAEDSTEPTVDSGETKPLVTASDSAINIRLGPSTDYQVIDSLPAGESLEIIGRNSDSSWWQVNTANGIGWIAASVTEASNVDENIPIADSPPLAVKSEDNESADDSNAAEVGTDASDSSIVVDGSAVENTCHPNAQITSPAPGSMFTSRVVTIRGYANVPNFDHYKIEYSTDPNNDAWNYLLEEKTPVENGALMLLETSTVPYGPYGVRLTVVDVSGNYPEPCIVWFNDSSFVPPTSTEQPSQSTTDTSEDAPCLCDGDYYNCGDFGSHWSAQKCFEYCIEIGRGDVHRLDRDNDFSVCESN